MKTTLLRSIHAFAQCQLKNRKIQTAISEPQSTHHSIWTMAVLVVFVLMSIIPSKAVAQQDVCNTTINYSGGYEDFVIPEGISDITFTAKGGDGGYGQVKTFLCVWVPFYGWTSTFVNDCKGNGGQGATVTATYNVGFGAGELQPGGTIRTVVGGAGQSRTDEICGGTSYEFGGGGGGTGVLYAPPGAGFTVQPLIVAGGGGGGFTQMFAGVCADQTAGGGGRNVRSGGNGTGLQSGYGAGSYIVPPDTVPGSGVVYSSIGGGGGPGGGDTVTGEALWPLAVSAGGGGKNEVGGGVFLAFGCPGFEDSAYIGYGSEGGTTGGAGGNTTSCTGFGNVFYNYVAVGGYGFGGGGAGFGGADYGIYADGGGGGGGGYSGGGGGGIAGSGGGGGSFLQATFPFDSNPPIAHNVSAGGSTPYPTNGFVSTVCTGTLFSDCPSDVTLNTDPGESFATTTLTAPTPFDECNALGNALNFDGVDDKVTISNPVGSVFTLEAWIKTSATSFTGTYAYEGNTILWSDVAFDANDFTLAILNDHLSFFDGSGSVATNGTTLLNDDAWHHVAVTRDGANGITKLYVDGLLEISNACNNVPLNANPEIVIGGNPFGGHFNGSIDEVRIWSEARTVAQLQNNKDCQLSEQTALLASYPFNEGLADGNNAGITIAADVSGIGNDGTLNDFALTGPLSNWVAGNAWSTLVGNAPATFPIGNTTVTWTVTAGGETSTCGQTITVIDNELPVITCDPDQDINTESGQCEPHITLSEPTVSDNGHPSTNALDFDGEDDFVDLGNVNETNFGQGDFTIEFWMKSVSTPSGPQAFQSAIMSKRSICDCANLWNVNLLVDGKLQFEALQAGCQYYTVLETAEPVNDGEWHHIAITRSSFNLPWPFESETSFLKIYIDGSLSTSVEFPFITFLNNEDPVHLGKSACSDTDFGFYYEGQLDEVRMWSYARSQGLINANKNAVLGPQDGLIVLQDMNEGLAEGDNTEETTAFDGSGNNHDGILNNFGLVGDSSNWVSRFALGLSVTNDAPDQFPIGETMVTWTVTDAGGNSATCTQNIAVTDNLAPVITCLPDLTLNTDACEDFATTTISPPEVTDNCSILGNALNFDGWDDGISLTTNGLPIGNSSRTLEARIRTTQEFAAIVTYGGFEINERFALYVSGGSLHFVGQANDYNSGVPINDGEWHHIAATHNGESLKLYVDGDLVLTQPTTFNTTSFEFSMGYRGQSTPWEYYQGDVEEVRLWDIARTQNEINTNMSSELALPQAGLVSYYKFNQGIPGGDNSAETSLVDELSTNAGEFSNFALTGPGSNWINNSEIIIVANDAPAIFPIGSTTVTWSATDQSGNMATCEQTVTVEENPDCLDCAGVYNGSAAIDECGICSGGDTGLTPNESCTDCEGTINGDALPGSICFNDEAEGVYDDDCNCVSNDTGSIDGNVAWLLSCGSRNLTIELYNQSDSELNEAYFTSIDASGDFTTPAFSTGTYDFYITVEGYLTQLYSAVTIGNGINELDVIGIIAGDIDGSNGANISDVSLLIAGFGSSQGDDNFIPLGDFNCDGAINIIDISILTISFGLVGDSPPND